MRPPITNQVAFSQSPELQKLQGNVDEMLHHAKAGAAAVDDEKRQERIAGLVRY